jgi:DNA-binding MarR family transcriptional regulator
MGKKISTDSDVGFSYGLVWGWLCLTNQRYGSMPTGELQIALTIVMLNKLGFYPTITDLTQLTNMPKSNVSRYVSGQMAKGVLEEYIDPSDRRRRKLRPSQKAGPELKWFEKQVGEIIDLVQKQQRKGEASHPDFNMFLENLRAITDRAIADNTN